MPDERTAALLAFAAELESRDEVVAREIEAVDALAARTVTLRARAREVGAALDRLPGELDDACRAETDARSEEVGARAALAAEETPGVA